MVVEPTRILKAELNDVSSCWFFGPTGTTKLFYNTKYSSGGSSSSGTSSGGGIILKVLRSLHKQKKKQAVNILLDEWYLGCISVPFIVTFLLKKTTTKPLGKARGINLWVWTQGQQFLSLLFDHGLTSVSINELISESSISVRCWGTAVHMWFV